VTIVKTRHFYTDRISEIQSYIVKAKIGGLKKGKVDESKLKYTPTWSYSIESMLNSSLEGPNETVSLCLYEDLNHENNNKNIKDTEYIYRKWEIYRIASLNPKYFRLDTSYYSIITADN
jgi:hypothetical protein